MKNAKSVNVAILIVSLVVMAAMVAICSYLERSASSSIALQAYEVFFAVLCVIIVHSLGCVVAYLPLDMRRAD